MAAELQGIPGASDAMKGFVQVLRLFLRDYGSLNRLISGEESNDRMLAWATCDALSKFNGSPPLTSYTLEELLANNQQHLLLRMAAVAAIESAALLQTRNHLNYSTGGINVGVNDKAPLWLQWLQLFKSETSQLLLRVKVALNIESILGPGNPGAHSEYWYVNSTYLSV